jgi:hypothetical protein
MPADLVDLSPARCAALLAPVVDRVFAHAMQSCREQGGLDLSARYGGPPAAGYLIEFRTRLAAPDGRVDPLGVAAVTRFRDQADVERMVASAVEAGTLDRDAHGSLRATARGHAFLAEFWRVQSRVLAEHWRGEDERIARLLDPLDRLLRNGFDSAGRGFATMAPPYEPDGASPAVRLLNRLGTWRHHRADTHALAWRVAGYTAASIRAQAPGPEREAVEAETDRLNGRGYLVLSPDQRLTLLADLGAMRG